MVRLGINGFGRIGRQVLKAVLERHKKTLPRPSHFTPHHTSPDSLDSCSNERNAQLPTHNPVHYTSPYKKGLFIINGNNDAKTCDMDNCL